MNIWRLVEPDLETFSQRRLAKLLGINRMRLYRARLASELPEELREHIFCEARKHKVKVTAKALSQVALFMHTGNLAAEVQRCPQCGYIVRIREGINTQLAEIVLDWLTKKRDAAGQ